ncbi:hypothetical protein QQS21_008682 [Conoideocrella luteorostrata]|uniref:DNA damage-responsive protein 48 n=1 Tax=Conoideocrella luteorostrata TaxID=1105319 RepID=A0AAJ0CIL1_9HYPO|nr:hypothetical protein QQS21_008682 [Conoideocrella luteorostrata]
MDFIKKATGGGDQSGSGNKEGSGNNESGDFGGMFKDKLNGMAGGGKQGEENEDGLDKAVDFVQEKFLGEGDQSNETAAEQAKDEAISDFIRDKYKTTTGKDFFIPDKEKKYGG